MGFKNDNYLQNISYSFYDRFYFIFLIARINPINNRILICLETERVISKFNFHLIFQSNQIKKSPHTFPIVPFIPYTRGDYINRQTPFPIYV